jgi:hypothetical protein
MIVIDLILNSLNKGLIHDITCASGIYTSAWLETLKHGTISTKVMN